LLDVERVSSRAAKVANIADSQLADLKKQVGNLQQQVKKGKSRNADTKGGKGGKGDKKGKGKKGRGRGRERNNDWAPSNAWGTGDWNTAPEEQPPNPQNKGNNPKEAGHEKRDQHADKSKASKADKKNPNPFRPKGGGSNSQ
jgi:hypothetical protein